jgi:hypothetical protein
MNAVTLDFLSEQLELGEQLLSGRDRTFEPQDLPGRYGCVVRAVDHVLDAIGCESVLAGGWAVWRHGFFGRMTQDVDIVLPAERVDESLQTASVSGFEILSTPRGRWPKVLHNETGIEVDVLAEGARPGIPSKPAPTTIPHPSGIGAAGTRLGYIRLPALIELKLAAGRARDESDIVELVRVNMDQVDAIRQHLAGVHPDYAAAFDRLVERAREQEDV